MAHEQKEPVTAEEIQILSFDCPSTAEAAAAGPDSELSSAQLTGCACEFPTLLVRTETHRESLNTGECYSWTLLWYATTSDPWKKPYLLGLEPQLV